MRGWLSIFAVYVVAFFIFVGGAGSARADCLSAAAKAEKRYGIPDDLLAAIGRAETGRADPVSGGLIPWSWTIDAAGQGLFLPDVQAAVARLAAVQAQGIGPIDVGCFQVDLTYHPDAFSTPEQAFDPEANADYAARFLGSLYQRLGSWPAAVAAYHSANPAIGAAYRDRVMALWRGQSVPAVQFGMMIWTPDASASSVAEPASPGLPHIIVPSERVLSP